MGVHEDYAGHTRVVNADARHGDATLALRRGKQGKHSPPQVSTHEPQSK